MPRALAALPALIIPALLAAAAPAAAEDAYPLDGIARSVAPKGPMRCPEITLVRWGGVAVKWRGKPRVNEHFATRLAAFEEVVADVGRRVLGRAPESIDHFGGYNCRRVRRYPDLLSEHGLGNAIDVAAFRFPALPKAARAGSALARRDQRALTVSVLTHWTDEGPRGQFLRALTAELERRPDIFRVMLGPAYPGHANHFHFDLAPYRLIVL